MSRIILILFVIFMVIIALKLFLPEKGSDFFSYPDDLNMVDGGRRIVSHYTGRDVTYTVYNWFFFVLTAFFCFVSLFVPIMYSEALDESDSELAKFITSFLFSVFTSLFILMFIEGIKYFFIFPLPSPVMLAVMLLYTMILFLSEDHDITGNMLVDTLIFSFVFVLTSFFFTLGLKINVIYGFPQFSLKLFSIMSAVLFMVFRIILWIEKD
ncbi:MAG: hypothetical protein JRI84_12635 [Deltaproteobacteria bacterium]|nr:hypothetical protein [Deltaproteobacteria bacterium]